MSGGRGAAEASLITLETLEGLLGYSCDMITVTDADGICTYASPAVMSFMGLAPSEVVGRVPQDFVHPDDYERLQVEAVQQILTGSAPKPIVYRQRCANNEYRHVEVTISELPPDHPLGVVVVATRDVADRVEADEARQASQRIVRMVADGKPISSILQALAQFIEQRVPGAQVAITRVSDCGTMLRFAAGPSLDPAFVARLRELRIKPHMGSCAAAALSQRPVMSADISEDGCWEGLREHAAAAGLRACWSTPIRSTALDGVLGTVALYWAEVGLPGDHEIGLMEEMAQLAAIAMARDHFESVLAHQASHDALTDLPNRKVLQDRLERALARRHRSRGPDVVVMFLDLDYFKDINDRLGHDVGDVVLEATAVRLSQSLRKVDTVARFGGDEFIVLTETSRATQLAERIHEAVALPIPWVVGLEVSCSIGVATAGAGDTAESLIRRADGALREAKQHRNCTSVAA